MWRGMSKPSSTQEQESSELGGRLAQENCVVEARLGYTVRFHLKEKTCSKVKTHPVSEFSVCLHVCASNMFVHMHLCVHQRPTSDVIVQEPHILILRQGLPLLWNPPSRLGSLATQPWQPAYVFRPGAGLASMWRPLWVFMGATGMFYKSGLHTCVSESLPAEPSPQPQL